MVTDGPFVETKEYLAGFWVIEAPDLDVALELAAEGSKSLQPEGRGAPVPGRLKGRPTRGGARAYARHMTIQQATGITHAAMLGLGVYRPERLVTNDEICEVLDSSDEWIQSRSGSGRGASPAPTRT